MSCSKCPGESSVVIYETNTELCWDCYIVDDISKETPTKCAVCAIRDGMIQRKVLRDTQVMVCEECDHKWGQCEECLDVDFIMTGLCPICAQRCWKCGEFAPGICMECEGASLEDEDCCMICPNQAVHRRVTCGCFMPFCDTCLNCFGICLQCGATEYLRDSLCMRCRNECLLCRIDGDPICEECATFMQ